MIKAPKIRMRNEPKRRVRFLTRQEIDTLLRELPPHLNAIVRFAYSTGFRMSNIVNLKWEKVDLVKRIAYVHADDTKNSEFLGVYLNQEAVDVIREQLGKHQMNVFTYHGRPVKRANQKAFKNALKRAGIKDFRFHDLRHTWASWHVQNGTPLYAVQEQGGWKGAAMVRRYAHLNAEHFAQYGESITKQGTKKDTVENC